MYKSTLSVQNQRLSLHPKVRGVEENEEEEKYKKSIWWPTFLSEGTGGKTMMEGRRNMDQLQFKAWKVWTNIGGNLCKLIYVCDIDRQMGI